jgi:hypothetical protein
VAAVSFPTMPWSAIYKHRIAPLDVHATMALGN